MAGEVEIAEDAQDMGSSQDLPFTEEDSLPDGPGEGEEAAALDAVEANAAEPGLAVEMDPSQSAHEAAPDENPTNYGAADVGAAATARRRPRFRWILPWSALRKNWQQKQNRLRWRRRPIPLFRSRVSDGRQSAPRRAAAEDHRVGGRDLAAQSRGVDPGRQRPGERPDSHRAGLKGGREPGPHPRQRKAAQAGREAPLLSPEQAQRVRHDRLRSRKAADRDGVL